MARRKTERLLDLIGFLLSRNEPASKQEIFGAVPGYKKKLAGVKADTAALDRMFERDKEELLGLGIPLQYVSPADFGPFREFVKEGYILNKEHYHLPHIDLTTEEFLALSLATQVAGRSAVFPFKEAATSALQKLAFDFPADAVDIPPLPIEFDPFPYGIDEATKQNLDLINDALLNRKWVEMSYYSMGRDELTERRVDPYGLVLKGGNWYLVGLCHLKSEIRVFNVSRVKRLSVNTKSAKSPDFKIPKRFDVRSYTSEQPWELWKEKRVEAKAGFDLKIAWWVKERFGAGGQFEEMEDGGGCLTLQVDRPDSFLRWVLTFKERAWIVEPGWLREQYISTVDSIRRRHG